ncbi:MAG TPA: hypothetical protein VFV34_15420, partial [Blastocatellia bacterium]|nr:hypothetical protein [Blastocatellia bacterium]
CGRDASTLTSRLVSKRRAAVAARIDAMTAKSDEISSVEWVTRMMFQGWLGVAIWMAIGLLLETLMAYKAPSYLDDAQRRELFRLAHAHGTLLHLILLLAALCGGSAHLKLPRAARIGLRFGAVMMPVGFFLAGLWHSEGDPGLFIWLVPVGAALLIFGMVVAAIASYRTRKESARRR